MSQSPNTSERQAADTLRDAHAAAPRASPARATPSELGFDVAIGDWEDLLGAVKSRLGKTAGELIAGLAPLARDARAERAQASLLDCVAALDQLQTTLRHELARREQPELELGELKAELAQTRRELVGTRAGERQARHLALHDSLTALPNRSFFQERLAHILDRDDAPELALLYFDLDQFKPVNDSHGHEVGDALLKIVAARLARAVRAGDLVSRMGGDEFACLIDRLPSREQLSHLACKLLDAVAAPAQVGVLMFSVRPSIGIVTCPGDGSSAQALLNNADAAMYRAKREKSGYAFFDPAVDTWASTA